MIPAVPGWRVVLADHENEGSVALPIVAWEQRVESVGFGAEAGFRREVTIEYLRAWYVPNETGVPPQPLSGEALVCGYLSPRQEWEPYWDEIANELLKIEREHQDREQAKRA